VLRALCIRTLVVQCPSSTPVALLAARLLNSPAVSGPCRLDVKTTFGPGVKLIDSMGRIVPLDKNGIVVTAVEHKAVYTTSPAPAQ